MTSKTRGIKAGNLMGATEVAAYLEVSRQRVLELRQKNKNFPEPVQRLSSGPVWDKRAIDDFIDQWDRTPGRPRKDASAGSSADLDPGEIDDDPTVPEQPTQESVSAGEAN